MTHEAFIHLKQRLTGPGGPFELAPEQNAATPERLFARGPHTLSDIYARCRAFGARPLLITEGEPWTFLDVLGKANALSARLTQLDVRRGSRVMLELVSPVDWASAFIAVTQLGASAVLPDPGWDTDKRDRWATDLECSVRIASVESASGWSPSELSAEQPSPTDEVLVTFTSGTTREAKAVSIDHRGLTTGLRSMMLLAVLNSARSIAAHRPASPPCTLTLSPVHYVGGYSALLFALMSGTPLVIGSGGIEAIVDLAERHQVSSIGGITRSHLLDLLDVSAQHSLKLNSLRALNYFGAKLEPDLLDRFARTFPSVGLSAGYGLTETNGSIASGILDHFRQKPGVAGRVSPLAAVRIVDDEGTVLGRDEVGNIELSGAFLARRYLARETGGEIRGRWFSTGDIGRLDDQNFLYVHGRREAAQFQGTTIDIAGLEEALGDLLNVRDVVVVPDHEKAFLTVGVSPHVGDFADALSLIYNRVGALPSQVEWSIFERFPMTPSGKIARAEVARLVRARSAAPAKSPKA